MQFVQKSVLHGLYSDHLQGTGLSAVLEGQFAMITVPRILLLAVLCSQFTVVLGEKSKKAVSVFPLVKIDVFPEFFDLEDIQRAYLQALKKHEKRNSD